MNIIGMVRVGVEKSQPHISAIVKVLLVSSMIYSFYFHLWHILFANLSLLLLFFTPIFLKRRYKIIIPKEFETLVLVFAIVSFFLGDVRGIFIQLFFGLLVGFIGFSTMVLYFKNNLRKDFFLISAFSMGFSISLGTMMEISKYLLKGFFNYRISLADYHYAIANLMMIIIGSTISIGIGYTYMTEHKMPFLRKIVHKFKKKNPNFFIKRVDSPEELIKLINEGENENLEFKSTLKTNLHTNTDDKRIEYAVLKTILGFLNTRGGILLIGVKDDGEITGIEKDNFENSDKFLLHLTNLLKEKIGKNFSSMINFKLILVEGKNVLRVECKKSSRPVFVKWDGKEEFFVRIGPATNQLVGKELVEYVKSNFK